MACKIESVTSVRHINPLTCPRLPTGGHRTPGQHSRGLSPPHRRRHVGPRPRDSPGRRANSDAAYIYRPETEGRSPSSQPAEPRSPAGTTPTMMPLQNGARAAADAEARGDKTPAAGPRRPGAAAAVLLLLLLRVAALCASAAAAALAATGGAALLGRAPFRLLLAADAVVAAYSALEAAAAAREAAGGATLLPEPVQLWFDFGHDQAFGYMALAAAAVAARDAASCGGWGSGGGGAACARADVAVGLGFAAFAFLALAALLTGFRVACFLATGSRFAPPRPPPPPPSFY